MPGRRPANASCLPGDYCREKLSWVTWGFACSNKCDRSASMRADAVRLSKPGRAGPRSRVEGTVSVHHLVELVGIHPEFHHHGFVGFERNDEHLQIVAARPGVNISPLVIMARPDAHHALPRLGSMARGASPEPLFENRSKSHVVADAGKFLVFEQRNAQVSHALGMRDLHDHSHAPHQEPVISVNAVGGFNVMDCRRKLAVSSRGRKGKARSHGRKKSEDQTSTSSFHCPPPSRLSSL